MKAVGLCIIDILSGLNIDLTDSFARRIFTSSLNFPLLTAVNSLLEPIPLK